MKRILIYVVVLIIAISFIVSSGCDMASNKKEVKEVIKIGAIFPLTGRFAQLGLPLKYATEIAVKDINSDTNLNYRIEVIYEDSKGNAKDAVNVIHKLIQADKIKLATTFLTGVSEAIKPITEQNEITLLAQTVAPTITNNTKYTYRFHYSFIEEGKVINNYINKESPKRIAIIYSNDNSTSYEVDSIIIPNLINNNIMYDLHSFPVGEIEFKGIVAKINRNKPDMIYIAGYGNDIPNILKPLYEFNLTSNMQICGNIGFIELPVETPFEYYKNITFTIPSFLSNKSNSKRMQFEKEYRELSRTQNIGYAAYYAYDAMFFLVENILEMKNNRQIDFSGLGGHYKVSSSGDISPNVSLARFSEGELEFLISN